jgi:hypothetical protein
MRGYLRHGHGLLIQKLPANLFDEAETRTYCGGWRDDLKSGYGTETTRGGTYHGQYLEGVRHGQGVMIFPDGTTYTGTLFISLWCLWCLIGSCCLSGMWDHNHVEGQGSYTHQDGSVFTGYFRDGRYVLSGKARCVMSDGSIYEGNDFGSFEPIYCLFLTYIY